MNVVRSCSPFLLVAGVIALNALFVLPQVAPELPNKPSLIFAIHGEFAAFLLVGVLVTSARYVSIVKRLGLGCLFLLWWLMWDEYFNRKFLQENTLLYDQLFLAKHLKFLIKDIWTWQIGVALVAAVVIFVAFVLVTSWIVQRVVERVQTVRRSRRLAGVAWVLAVLAVGTSFSSSWTPRVVWGTPPLVGNIRDSVQMYRAIRRTFGASPYQELARNVRLVRKPHINLFLVESYGRVLMVDEQVGDLWRTEVQRLNDELEAQGWHCVTGFSVAPVSGGRSWLAEATLLSGIRVRYEAVFRHLVQEMDTTPHLVAYLQAQGYEASLLAPKERELQGLPLENNFGYDHILRRDDLEYKGRRVGWGEIPDQYTLGYADEHLFSRIEAPQFINFHMVSSHAPWSAVPRIVTDWKTFNDERPDGTSEEDGGNLDEVLVHLKRFRRVEPRFTYMGEMDQLKVEAYWGTILYDLLVIQRYLLEHQDDRLVLVMGDHQPPFISTADGSYDVPLHIFARDPSLLAEFKQVGFIDGMVIDASEHPVILHEGLFSLLVRALGRCCGEPGAKLPAVDYDGVPL